MQMKLKLLWMIVATILAFIIFLSALYFGISCIATFQKAHTQPYLTTELQRYDFMGYYVMSAANGLVSVLMLFGSILLFSLSHKQLRKNNLKSKHSIS